MAKKNKARSKASAAAAHSKRKAASLQALRREYCAARDRYDEVGRELGRMTGAHKKSPHRKRHIGCRVRSSR